MKYYTPLFIYRYSPHQRDLHVKFGFFVDRIQIATALRQILMPFDRSGIWKQKMYKKTMLCRTAHRRLRRGV
jgi:hypothetical protein